MQENGTMGEGKRFLVTLVVPALGATETGGAGLEGVIKNETRERELYFWQSLNLGK